MALAVFGPGSLYVTRNDIPNQTPINVGYCNEFSYDESAESKALYGSLQYALAEARGTIKATGKIKAAKLSGIALNAVFHGQSFAAGSLVMSQTELGTLLTNAVTVANAAHFDTDLGIIYASGASAGLPFQKMPPATPQATLTVGQYTVAAGVYTFSTADQTAQAAAGATPLVGITYVFTSTAGQSLTVMNTPIGTTPTFQIDYATTDNGQAYYGRFFACVSTKLSKAFKLSDFMMPEIDFGFFANAAGQVYKAGYSEVS